MVLKTAEEAIHHKTEADGVRLGLADRDAVGAAYDDLAARLGPRVLVQRQVTGVEVALGIVRDPLLGPLVVVAAGGVLVELVAERAVALPPVDRETAREMVRRAARRPAARRLPRLGARRCRRAASTRSSPSVSSPSSSATTSTAVDLNPVVVGPDSALVVDALVLPADPPTPRRS